MLATSLAALSMILLPVTAGAATPAAAPPVITLGCEAKAAVMGVAGGTMALVKLDQIGDRGVLIRATITANGRSQVRYTRGNIFGMARFAVKIAPMRPGQVMTVQVAADSHQGFGWACRASARR